MKLKKILLLFGILYITAFMGCGDSVKEEALQQETKKESEVVDAQDELMGQILSAYQEILKTSPAIEGEHDELMDASFGYEENQRMFGNHYDYFALYDMNQDGLPELIVNSIVNFRWAPISIFTYVDGKVVLLQDPVQPSEHSTFEQCSVANGAYITYICEEKHIHSKWSGTHPVTNESIEENYAYMLEGTTLIPRDCFIEENENAIDFYDIAKPNVAENVDMISGE